MTIPSNDPWRESWIAINARAWWCLEHSADLPPSVSRGKPFHGLPRLRMWDDAMGFGCEAEPTTLTVYELFDDLNGREPVVREAIWLRTEDLNRVSQEVKRSNNTFLPNPTIAVRDARLPADQLETLLNEGTSYLVPVTWFTDEEAVTCDVGSCGLEFFGNSQPPASLRLEWSWDAPPEWDPVREWSGRLQQLLESCLQDDPGDDG